MDESHRWPQKARTTNIAKENGTMTELQVHVQQLEFPPNKIGQHIKQTGLHEVSHKRPLSKQKRGTVKAYRPDYTWNRKGRLREIRIRTIARKYVKLWCRKVFGRVLPSQAILHHEKRLQRRCWNDWKDEWWIVRREWGLYIRAELHYKYCIVNKIWKAWRSYTATHRVKTKKLQHAVQFHQARLKVTAFNGWRAYIQIRNAKFALYMRADDIAEQSLVRQAWKRWVSCYEEAQVHHKQEQVAAETSRLALITRSWITWRRQLELAQAARLHHQMKLKSKCLQALQLYMEHRRHQKFMKKYADDVNRQNTLRHHFQYWHQQMITLTAMRQHQDNIAELASRSRLRRVFVAWLSYVQMRREKRHKLEVALFHYATRLQYIGFASLRLNVAQQRVKVLMKQQADDLCRHLLIRRAWQCWKQHLEEAEDWLLSDKFVTANNHHNRVLMSKALKALQGYVTYKKHRREQVALAEAHFYCTALPFVFSTWREYVEHQKWKREMEEQALEFHKEHTQRRLFSLWCESFEQSKNIRMLERMAILHYDENLTERFFKMWKAKTEEKLKEHYNIEVATAHYETKLCEKVLHVLHQLALDGKADTQNDLKARRHHNAVIMKKAWGNWKLYLDLRRVKKRKQLAVDQYRRQVVLVHCMTTWQLHHAQMKQILHKTEVMWNEKCHKTLKWAFEVWRNNCKEEKREREKRRAATLLYEHNLMLKIFKAWHEYIIERVLKLQHREKQFLHVTEVLNRLRIASAFKQWKVAKDEMLMNRLNMEKSTIHHEVTLKHKVLHRWQQYSKLKLKKQLLFKQCLWFHDQRLKAKTFVTWKARLTMQQEHNKKVMLALWHWSVTLERKVLECWFAYAHERKRKKKRYERAAELYGERLVKDAAVHWLAVASELQAMRQHYALSQGLQSAAHVQRVVRHCVDHWRAWTSRRKRLLPHGALRHSKHTAYSVQTSNTCPVVTPMQNSQIVRSLNRASPVNTLSSVHRMNTSPENPMQTRASTFMQNLTPVHSVTPVKLSNNVTSNSCAVRPMPRMPSFLKESLERQGMLYLDSQTAINTDFMENTESQQKVTSSEFMDMNKDSQCGFSGTKSSAVESQGSHSSQSGLLKLHSATDISKGINITSKEKHSTGGINMDNQTYVTPKFATESDTVSVPNKVAKSQTGDNELMIASHVQVANPNRTSNLQLLPPSAFLPSTVYSSNNEADGYQYDYNSISAIDKPAFLPLSDSCTPVTQHNHVLSSGDSFATTVCTSQNLMTAEGDGLMNDFVSPAEEITYIRNQLVIFKNIKEKLKTCVEQKEQLEHWIKEQKDVSDPEVKIVLEELDLLLTEESDLQDVINREKARMKQLATRAQQLLNSH